MLQTEVKRCFDVLSWIFAVYLRAPDGSDLTYAIRAVEFKLHETFPEPIRGESARFGSEAAFASPAVLIYGHDEVRVMRLTFWWRSCDRPSF
jgi:hypothetical protein